MTYHKPVLLDESLELLQIKPGGIYVDVTFGGGGHSRAILSKMEGGRLLAFDQDKDALPNIPQDSRFTLITSNFRHLEKSLRFHGIRKIDGLLADLGISSHQIDEAERGFSLRFEGPLDMRMNDAAPLSAYEVVNKYEEGELSRVFKDYGELHNARRIARIIIQKREEKPIKTTEDLKNVLKPLTPGHKGPQFLARIFQAIRIEVNDEIGALHELLEQSNKILKPGGRLVFISYHSLEDRPVKNFFRYGNTEGEIKKDFYGNLISPLKPVNRKPLVPSDEETADNPRARSAKLRAAEKLEDGEGEK